MIYMLILIFITGISIFSFAKDKIKVSDILVFPIIIGISIHTIIFTLLVFINLNYELYQFVAISLLSLLMIAYNKNYKKFLHIENDFKKIPIYYIVFVVYVLFRLITIASTLTLNYFSWDELNCYQLGSKMMLTNHDFSYLYKVFTPINYFWGTLTYQFSGYDLTIPRLIMPILFITMSVFIYKSLKELNVSRHISALISMIFVVSSAEMILTTKTFYSNMFFGIYFLIGTYLVINHYFIQKKKNIPFFEYFILFSVLLARREALFLLIPIVIIINLILVNKKNIKIKNALLILSVPIGFKLIETIANKINVTQITTESSPLPIDYYLKNNFETLTSYIKNIYRQTLSFDSYFYNFLIFAVLIVLIIVVIYNLVRKQKKELVTASLLILIFEFGYIIMIIITQFMLFTVDEFSIAASFSRYILAVIPINFILLGGLLFSNIKKEEEELCLVRKEKNLKNPKILLIIPAYNEEQNILNTYNTIINFNKKSIVKYDLIVINDGSKDNTGKICEENKIPTINLIQNLGIGGAVQTGYKYAYENKYDIAIQYDGDGQHDVNCVKDIINPIIEGKADFVIGSRFVTGAKSEFKSTASRRIGINIISILMKIITKIKIYDTTSGFRAVNGDIIALFAKSYPTEYPEPITTTELLTKNYVVSEIGVKMQERTGGKSSIGSWKNVYYMINVSLSIIIEGLRRHK